jgi:hypothetical protein
MLRVYRTLVRMQYLEESWIVEGPHDLTSALPTCERLQLADSIIYLYSILPYVDHQCANGRGADFFQRSVFVDFRAPDWVEGGRWPLSNEEEENHDEFMPPWMTPLSAIGNHTTFLVYDAREHIISIRDEGGQDCDDNIGEGNEFRDLTEDEYRRLVEDAGSDDDVPLQFGDENWEGSGDEYEDDSENIWDDNLWADLYACRAPNVPRDIVKWYEELTKLPGGGEASSCAWFPEIIKPLYIKHGWPRVDFDGEAFLIDQAREDASRSAGYRHGVEPEQVTLRDQLADLESTLSYWWEQSSELGGADAASRANRLQREYQRKQVRIYQKALDACEAKMKLFDESFAR